MDDIFSRFKAIIFDLDGTILDTSQHWHRASRNLLARRGFAQLNEHQEHMLNSLAGVHINASSALLREHFNLSEPLEEIMTEKLTLVHELLTDDRPPFIPGFESFVAFLREKSIPHSIATNADDRSLASICSTINLGTYFGSHIYNLSSVQGRAKPDPALFLHAAKSLGFQPEECVVFEDSAPGFRAACAAGMACIAIRNAHNAPHLELASESIAHYGEAIDALRRLLIKR